MIEKTDLPPHPIFSIIIPTFKREILLQKTLDSFYQNPLIGEVIVVNDDPDSDLTLQIEKVVVVNPKTKLGESGAINLGWTLARFQYVMVVSDDDPQESQLFQRTFETIAANPNYLVYYPNSREISENRIIRCSIARPFSNDSFYGLIRCPCLAGVTIDSFLAKELGFGEIRDSGIVFPSDLIQWFELSIYGKFMPVNTAYANWWRHEAQMTTYLSNLNSSKDYFLNVSRWFSIHQECIQKTTSWAILFRSLQILSSSLLTRAGAMLAIDQLLSTLKVMRDMKFNYLQIFVSLIIMINGLIDLKGNHDS